MIDCVYIDRPIKYEDFLPVMESKVDSLINKNSPNTVYFLEHEDVYTAGSVAKESEFISNSVQIPKVYTNRGGRWTYHGAGQRVIYPIIDLCSINTPKDIKSYINKLQICVINTLSYFKIRGYPRQDAVGVWVEENGLQSKIAFIGVKVRKWIAYHGISININTDIGKYDAIVPCGINNLSITSLKEIGVNINISDIDDIFLQEFCKIFY